MTLNQRVGSSKLSRRTSSKRFRPQGYILSYILLVAALAATSFAPLARADDTDDAYLRALHNHGITGTNGDAGLIHAGHMLCGMLESGYSMNSLLSMGDLYARNGLTPSDVRFLVATSAAAYCPDRIP